MSDEDDTLLALLAEALVGSDELPSAQLPAGLTAFARGVHRLHQLESELAEIERDSLIDASATRSSDAVRTIEFAFDTYRVILEVHADQILGSVRPEPPSSVQLERLSGRQELTVNDRGFFGFVDNGAPFRLLLGLATGVNLHTDWIRLG